MNQLQISINGKEVTKDDIYCFDYKGKTIFIGTEDYWEVGKKGKRGNIFIGSEWYDCNDIQNARKISFEEFDRLTKREEQFTKGVYYTRDTIAGKYGDYVVRKYTRMKQVKKDIEAVGTYYGYWKDGKKVRIEEGKFEFLKPSTKEERDAIRAKYKIFTN